MGGTSFEEALRGPGPIRPVGDVGVGLVAAGDDQELSGLEAYIALGAGGSQLGILGQLTEEGLATEAVNSPGATAGTAFLGSAGRFGTPEEVVQEAALVVIPDGFGFSAEDLSRLIASSPAEEVMLVVAAPVRSSAMRSKDDEVTPLIVARGSPTDASSTCAPLSRCARGITSDSTRRDGVVSNVDIAPTILNFLGVPIPEDVIGSPIRIEGEPPVELHERYLQYQTIRNPIGLLALATALITLFVSLVVVLGPWRPGPTFVRAVQILVLSSMALPAAMLAASLLSRLSFVPVLLALLGGSAVLTTVALFRRGGDSTAPVAIAAGLGMGMVILDGVLGWPSMLTPLLGDTALEGVRFYGMGNAYAGVFMAGAILVASRIPAGAGVGLLIAAGLLTGLPGFGAELGTAVTLFAAAGLAYGLRVRGRLENNEIAIAAGLSVIGLVALLLIHRFSAMPTHVTRVAAEAERSGAGAMLEVFARRFALNVRNTTETPTAWLVVAALPLWLVVVSKRLGPFAPTLRRHPEWRDTLIVLALASIIGFIVNDSVGVAGLGLVYLSAALIYPALEERWKIV
jgi:hypothetical protein